MDYYAGFCFVVDWKSQERAKFVIAVANRLRADWTENDMLDSDNIKGPVDEAALEVLTQVGLGVGDAHCGGFEVYANTLDPCSTFIESADHEYGNHEGAAYFVHALLKHFDLPIRVAFDVGFSASRPAEDAYGGGAWFITHKDIKYFHTREWCDQQLEAGEINWRVPVNWKDDDEPV